ncbi:glycosyl hydrolase catalytic core-domain-containing protein [Xylaria intraflava]|nr:glycosyl hydrolase catalytic core-domain-containing protein [Xylaria intraflava]
MYPKASLMALCAAATVKGALGAHGHHHAHADKRDVVWAATETVVVTDYYTVTAGGQQHPTGAAPNPIKERPGNESSAEDESSTSTVVVHSSTSTSHPTVTPTTLATQVRPTTSSKEVTTTTSAESTAAPAAPSVPAPAAPAAPKASKSAKRGLAYNDVSLVKEYVKLGGEASWAYNWGPSASGLPSGVTYYPMLWSPAPDHSNGWATDVKEAISKGADALLGFNEPDIAAQANLSPQAAASAHIQWMNPYEGKARISSPAISSSENANQGIDWLKKFFTACDKKCKVDFCVAHWYGPGGTSGANQFLQHLKDVHSACDNKPIWVTEFAAQSGDVDQFMTAIVKALESSEYSFVEKYSYFMASVGELFLSTTSLSSFGKIYAGLS